MTPVDRWSQIQPPPQMQDFTSVAPKPQGFTTMGGGSPTMPSTAPPISSLISIFTGNHGFGSPITQGGMPGSNPHPQPQIPGGRPGPTGGPTQGMNTGMNERYGQYQQMQQRVPQQYQNMLPQLPGWAGYLQWLASLRR